MPEAPEARKTTWTLMWKGVNVTIRLAIAAGILMFLFYKIGGEEIWDAFRRFHWLALAAAVLGYCGMQAIKAHRLQILLRQFIRGRQREQTWRSAFSAPSAIPSHVVRGRQDRKSMTGTLPRFGRAIAAAGESPL